MGGEKVPHNNLFGKLIKKVWDGYKETKGEGPQVKKKKIGVINGRSGWERGLAETGWKIRGGEVLYVEKVHSNDFGEKQGACKRYLVRLQDWVGGRDEQGKEQAQLNAPG